MNPPENPPISQENPAEQKPPEEGPKEKPTVDQKKQPKTVKNMVKNIQQTQHVKSKNITLSEDTFGTLFDENGYPRPVKRFTWKNHNNIKVQIITYGARITSIKIPDKKGNPVDVVMGFDDLAGYLYYDNHLFGATIGRVASKVENGTFVIDGKQYWISQNDDKNHANGGRKGLDKAIWNHYVVGTKVILTHMSYDKEEGYPGDLLVKITYELTAKNEFSMDMEAVTTKPTIVNLSQLNYINLGGHNSGPEELYKHMLTINANCYTLNDQEKNLPTGEIMNVSYSKYDFQVPTLLGNLLGVGGTEDAYDQNLCVNRGVDQGNAFVARLLHVPSGRLLELYSNQWGVNLYTADRLGNGLVDIPVTLSNKSAPSPKASISMEEESGAIDLVNKLHEKLKDTLEADKENNYSELRDLIRKLQSRRALAVVGEEEQPIEDEDEDNKEADISLSLALQDLKLSPFQLKYLDDMREITENVESVTDYTEIREIINRILKATTEFNGQMEGVEAYLQEKTKSLEEISLRENLIKTTDFEDKPKAANSFEEERMVSVKNVEIEAKLKAEVEKELKRKGMIIPTNRIPTHYMDGRIHGKKGCIYKKHGAICLQTQNFPNAIYHQNFPNCILRPGETYRHTVVYKFYKQAGNPNKWIKQYNHDLKKKCINVSKLPEAPPKV